MNDPTRQTHIFAWVAAFTLITCITTTSWAQDTKPVFNQGSRPIAMGEAFNALSQGPDGVYHNPAGIARALMYSLDGSFNYQPDGTVLSATIVDSKTNPAISAGLGAGYYFSTKEGVDINALDIRLSLALPIVPDRVSFGIGGRYLIVNNNNIETINGFTLDAGILLRIVDELHVGVVAKNLIDPCSKTVCRGYVPRTLGGGVAYSANGLTIAADADADFNSTTEPKLNFGVGAEYFLQDMFPIRLGFIRDSVADTNAITVGSGWRSTAAGIDLSYRHNLSVNAIGLISLTISAYF